MIAKRKNCAPDYLKARAARCAPRRGKSALSPKKMRIGAAWCGLIRTCAHFLEIRPTRLCPFARVRSHSCGAPASCPAKSEKANQKRWPVRLCSPLLGLVRLSMRRGWSALWPKCAGPEAGAPGKSQTDPLNYFVRLMTPSNAFLRFAPGFAGRSTRMVGSLWYALERLRTLYQAASRPVGTHWNALVRLRTPFLGVSVSRMLTPTQIMKLARGRNCQNLLLPFYAASIPSAHRPLGLVLTETYSHVY